MRVSRICQNSRPHFQWVWFDANGTFHTNNMSESPLFFHSPLWWGAAKIETPCRPWRGTVCSKQAAPLLAACRAKVDPRIFESVPVSWAQSRSTSWIPGINVDSLREVQAKQEIHATWPERWDARKRENQKTRKPRKPRKPENRENRENRENEKTEKCGQ